MHQFVLADMQDAKWGGVRYVFDGADANAVVFAVSDYFARRGYVLEDGTPFNGMYGKGSAVARVLVGGLTTRFKFKVAVYAGEGVALLDVRKGMSGVWGGVLGFSKMRDEFAMIQDGLRAL